MGWGRSGEWRTRGSRREQAVLGESGISRARTLYIKPGGGGSSDLRSLWLCSSHTGGTVIVTNRQSPVAIANRAPRYLIGTPVDEIARSDRGLAAKPQTTNTNTQHKVIIHTN